MTTVENLRVETVLDFCDSAGGNVQIDRITLQPGELIPCQGYPEERLYYVQSGYGVLSVYAEIENGDNYILRPDVTAYHTPGLLHEIANTGEMPMHLVVFRVRGGLVPEGAEDGVQKWTSIGKSAAVGTGFWYTDIFNLQENETAREGQFLQVWGVGMCCNLAVDERRDAMRIAKRMKPSTSLWVKDFLRQMVSERHSDPVLFAVSQLELFTALKMQEKRRCCMSASRHLNKKNGHSRSSST